MPGTARTESSPSPLRRTCTAQSASAVHSGGSGEGVGGKQLSCQGRWEGRRCRQCACLLQLLLASSMTTPPHPTPPPTTSYHLACLHVYGGGCGIGEQQGEEEHWIRGLENSQRQRRHHQSSQEGRLDEQARDEHAGSDSRRQPRGARAPAAGTAEHSEQQARGPAEYHCCCNQRCSRTQPTR